jgi:hypothetical protein
MRFKSWLNEVEQKLPSSLKKPIIMGQARKPQVSGFCLHNKEINQFARKNPTQMFLVLAFVLYTVQKEWQVVRQTFPEFIKWIFEEAIPKDDWDFARSSFASYANRGLGIRKEGQSLFAEHVKKLWDKRQAIFSNVSKELDKESSDVLSTASPEFNIYTYLGNNVDGLALAKAAFATQLMTGKFGCIDSVNMAAYDSYIRKDIQTNKKTVFKLVPRKGAKGDDILDAEGNPIMDVAQKRWSGVAARGYVDFLNKLQELAKDDISKVLWNDWCEIVAQKVVKSGTGEIIKLKVNDQDFEIKPYMPKSHLATMMQKEKDFINLVDPKVKGTAISRGHLDPLLASLQYTESDIEESYAQMASELGSDLDALHHITSDFLKNISLKNAFERITASKKVKMALKGADFIVGFNKMIELFGDKIASSLAIYQICKSIAFGNDEYKKLSTLNNLLSELLSIAKNTAKNPILAPVAVGAGAYGLGFDDFIEIAGKFKFGSLLYFYISQIIDAIKDTDVSKKLASSVKDKAKQLLGV